MRKKVDLNKPKNTNQSIKNKNVIPRSITTNTSNNEEEEQKNPSLSDKAKQKTVEVALQYAGVPAPLAKELSKNEKLMEEITMTKKKKQMTFLLIGGAVSSFLVALILISTLFFNSSKTVAGVFTMAKECSTITIIDTDCDELGENCTNKYSGNVPFEDYIAGVVSAEFGPAPNNLEYYKAASIAVRTHFLTNIQSECTIQGNLESLTYMDVNESSASKIIKEAVNETKGKIILEKESISYGYYSDACTINDDNNDYYIRYGSTTLENPEIQKIPKLWDTSESVFTGRLGEIYEEVDTREPDYQERFCPDNNNDYGMSKIGAFYLITKKNYDYEQTLKYYYGNEISFENFNELTSEEVNGFVNPTNSINCSSPFGERIHPVSGESSFHSGIDIAIPGGEPVYATKDGVISSVVNNVSAINTCSYGYGNHIIIEHDDGSRTLYAHLKYGSIPSTINAGDAVEQGEEIGKVGSTGCSTGNHLHYEISVNGSNVDPADYMELSSATGTCKR